MTKKEKRIDTLCKEAHKLQDRLEVIGKELCKLVKPTSDEYLDVWVDASNMNFEELSEALGDVYACFHILDAREEKASAQ